MTRLAIRLVATLAVACLTIGLVAGNTVVTGCGVLALAGAALARYDAGGGR